MLIYSGVKETQAYPGVAKFGIALEWGSRGLEFESRHSDQKSRTEFSVLDFLFSDGEIRTIQMQQFGGLLPATARRSRTLILPQGQNANESRHSDQDNTVVSKEITVFF